jgi:transketolase C-terminal domain/subunit
MGLEDIAIFCAQPDMTVLYPSDAVSAWESVSLLAQQTGPGYLRLGRPAAPILYSADARFEIGKCKVLRQTIKTRQGSVVLSDGPFGIAHDASTPLISKRKS